MTHTGRLLSFAIVAALGGLLFGFDSGVISGTLPFLKTHFALNPHREGVLVSSLLVACVCGALFAGTLAEWFGRKKVLICCAIWFAVSAIASALPTTLEQLIIARVLGGVAAGVVSVVAPMYVTEISPAHTRGRLVAVNQLAIVVGILLSYLSNWLLVDTGTHNWRYMLAAETFPSVLFFLGLFFIPESPRWLIGRGRGQDALNAFRKVTASVHAEKELEDIKRDLRKQRPSRSALFHPEVRRVLIVGWLLALFANLTGINVIIYYGTRIFMESGFETNSALLASVIVGFANLIFTIVGMFLIDSVGRRRLLMLGTAGMGISLALVGFCMQSGLISPRWSLLWVMTYIGSFAASIGVVIWVYLSEIYPNRLRAQAVSLATMVLWLGNVVLAYVFPWMLEKLAGNVFYVLALICLLAFLFIVAMVKETKGIPLEEIEQMWQPSRP